MIFRRKNKHIPPRRVAKRVKREKDQDIAFTRKVKAKMTSQKVLYPAAVCLFFGVVVYVLFFSPLLRVSAIEIKGLEKISPSEVREMIARNFEGKYMRVIRKNNILFIYPHAIENILTREFKDIERAQVRKQFPNRLLVQVRERELSLFLCDGEWCYTIDQNGVAYSKVEVGSFEINKSELPILQSGSGRHFETGDSVLDSEYIQYLANIEEKLSRDLNIEAERNLFTPHLASGDIRVKTKEGWALYFDRNISLQKEIDMLRVVLKKSVENERRRELEYIDLRTDNKVYFKYTTSDTAQEEQQEAIETPQPEPAKEKDKESKKKDKKD